MKKKNEYKVWLREAEEDFNSSLNMLKNNEYIWSLFILHLSMEKLLKAIWLKKIKTLPPKTHNLVLLAKELGLSLTKREQELLIEITRFNILVRYPDNEPNFRKICNKKFTQRYIKEGQLLFEKLKKTL